MDLRRLTYFVAIAEEQHFGRAAQRLVMTQPALSHAIARLEREMGTQLLERSSRQVRLTPAGAALLPAAHRILNDVERATHDVLRVAAGTSGSLTIGCLAVGAYTVLVPTLPLFRAAHPDVLVSVQEMPTTQQGTALAAGLIDVGLLRPPVDPGLATRVLLDEPYLAALPVGHPLAEGDGPLDLAALAEEDFVYLAREIGTGPFDQMIVACAGAGFSPRLTHRAVRPETLVTLVSCGLGVALVPATMSQVTSGGLVVYRPLRGEPLRVRIVAAWRPPASPPVAGLLDVLRVRLPGRPGSDPVPADDGPS